ncbi:MAG: Gfo/Idh/MocA family protein [Oscillospiraceae bacterium]
MPDRVKIVFIGVGGYGGHNLGGLLENGDTSQYEIVGAVDPFAKTSPHYQWLLNNGIPLYNLPEEFYANNNADLAVISTPIHLHKEQALTALKNGSNVICEKPIVPLLQQADELRRGVLEADRQLAVGYQWSFCRPILDFKRDILSGKLGKPLHLKSYIAWQRFDNYYQSGGWKGRLQDDAGNWILDSVSTNATAHYLHNIFFMMGERLDSSRMPSSASGTLLRAKDIESFDTIFLAGDFDNGADFLFISTHSGDVPHEPAFSYEFENAVVTLNEEEGSEIVATFRDGSTHSYGNPFTSFSLAEKLVNMIGLLYDGEGPGNTCPLDAALPHLLVSNALFDQAEIKNFPAELVFRTEDPAGSLVKGLSEQCDRCFAEQKLPSQLGFSWAEPETVLSLNDYKAFSGARLLK